MSERISNTPLSNATDKSILKIWKAESPLFAEDLHLPLASQPVFDCTENNTPTLVELDENYEGLILHLLEVPKVHREREPDQALKF